MNDKGGVESTVRIAKADIVPTDANLLDQYETFAELDQACRQAMDRFNGRVHAMTRRVPAEMLLEERAHLHPVPAEPYTVAFGESRTVSWSSVVTLAGARYSVPTEYRDTRVWVRVAGDEVIVTAGGPDGAVEIARHERKGPGGTSIKDEHYPPRRDPAEHQPKPTNPAEAAFLALGEGARLWLVEAAAVGTRGIEARMADAALLTKVVGAARVDEALQVAAMAGRFSAGDLESIIDARNPLSFRPDPAASLQPGTAGWAGLGTHASGAAQ